MISKQELPVYKQLFCRIFSEDPAFCDRIFAHRLEQVFDKRKNGEIVSFLYAIPFAARVGGAAYRAMYVYGVGTVEEERGQGYMKEVFRSMEAHYGKSVDFYYLVPAGEHLFPLYESIGYRVGFYLKKELIFPKKNASLTYEIREAKEEFHPDYLGWVSSFHTAILRTEADSAFFLDGGTYSKIGESGFFWEVCRGTVHLREMYFQTPHTLACFLDFLAKKGYDAVIATLPKKQTPYAMVKPVHPALLRADFSCGYTNLNFD